MPQFGNFRHSSDIVRRQKNDFGYFETQKKSLLFQIDSHKYLSRNRFTTYKIYN
jgi:hypothetical protein